MSSHTPSQQPTHTTRVAWSQDIQPGDVVMMEDYDQALPPEDYATDDVYYAEVIGRTNLGGPGLRLRALVGGQEWQVPVYPGTKVLVRTAQEATTEVAIPFPAAEVWPGDNLIDHDVDGGTASTVVALADTGNQRTITLANGHEHPVDWHGTVTLVVPVHAVPPAGVTLYRADGSTVLRCTCVYRLLPGAWDRVWNSDPHCTSLGHGALADEED